MNAPEYWRISLAVDKVIIRHEFEILEKEMSVLVNGNPFMALYATTRLAVFVVSASARLNKIISDGKAAGESPATI